MGVQLIAEHRKARFEYEIIEQLEAGLVLTGSEVKALREGRANLTDGFVRFKNGEVFLESIHISPYPNGGYANHDAKRVRKLLMHRKEMERWRGKVQEKGLTAIPLRMYFKNGFAKIEIALARGKKIHDKRETLRKKAMDREARAAIKARARG
ncbi:MAG: SsrA-binding protein SmpB [Acidobacteria bacterium]|nr:SsrA-binding protein SmpB [Acidobacteriota bacterium]